MTQEINVLVADDDAAVLANCMKFFMRDLPLAKFASAHSPSECRSLIRTEKYNVILLDISFDNSPVTGLALLPEIREFQPTAKIFMLSSRDDEKTVLQAMNLGAADFISKSTNEFPNIAATVRSHIEGEAKNLIDLAEGKTIASGLGIAFSSTLMASVFAKVAVARRNRIIPVLITGETGAGKDVLAKAISQGDGGRPAITLDCGAIPEALAESEFFGHMRGSFTGADSNKIGSVIWLEINQLEKAFVLPIRMTLQKNRPVSKIINLKRPLFYLYAAGNFPVDKFSGQPARLDHKIIGQRGFYSDATGDHHAFYYDESLGIFAILAVELIGRETDQGPNMASTVAFSGAIVMAAEGGKIVEKARITHEEMIPDDGKSTLGYG
jgi:DNA-binding NarL/FixJ family response regulator